MNTDRVARGANGETSRAEQSAQISRDEALAALMAAGYGTRIRRTASKRAGAVVATS